MSQKRGKVRRAKEGEVSQEGKGHRPEVDPRVPVELGADGP